MSVLDRVLNHVPYRLEQAVRDVPEHASELADMLEALIFVINPRCAECSRRVPLLRRLSMLAERADWRFLTAGTVGRMRWFCPEHSAGYRERQLLERDGKGTISLGTIPLAVHFGASNAEPQQRSAPNFEEINVESEYSARSITKARDTCTADEWSKFEEELRQLPIVDEAKTKALLSELHDGESHCRASSLHAAMCFAAQRTHYNAGSFAELARRVTVESHPVSYLMALHSWRQAADAFGTKASYFVRIGQNSWLCAGQTTYGS